MLGDSCATYDLAYEFAEGKAMLTNTTRSLASTRIAGFEAPTLGLLLLTKKFCNFFVFDHRHPNSTPLHRKGHSESARSSRALKSRRVAILQELLSFSLVWSPTSGAHGRHHRVAGGWC